MQEYLQRSRLGEAMDALGFRFLALILSLGWFILLWGVRLPAIAAGLSLFCLIMLLERKTRDARLRRKESRLRIQLGGEMLLEKLLMEPPAKAHFEAAAIFSAAYPLQLLQAGKEGVLCRLRNEPVLFSFFQSPSSAQADAAKALFFQRSAKERGAARLILCVPCKISTDAYRQGKGEIPITFLDRDTLITHFGAASPATDAQLVALGKRKRVHAPATQWLRLIFSRARAKRYILYGILLLALYLLTHLLYYGLPALFCFFLAAGCHCAPRNQSVL
ncbi:MAG: hypothetical protein E7329_04070 [Clostridiales bacterium]|nr:hypothetical protein [Clostridiales bacterium]